MISCKRMILGWLIFLRITISDMRLSRNLALSLAVAISLMATSVPWTLCLACHTTENEPDPICRPTKYSPTTPPLPIACAIATGTLGSEPETNLLRREIEAQRLASVCLNNKLLMYIISVIIEMK